MFFCVLREGIYAMHKKMVFGLIKLQHSASGVFAVWYRNASVWRRLALPSILGNVLDPLIALVAFGFGLGALMPDVQGIPYMEYLVCGALALSAMNAATFEALYSAFTRMHVQKTWDAILNTPLSLTQVVLGEWIWAATKSAMAAAAMLVFVIFFGFGDVLIWFKVFCFLVLGALMFSAFALCINALARSYDFFMFYFTLCVTPMTFLSGAIFPRAQLPKLLQVFADFLPLSLLVDVIRVAFKQQQLDLKPKVLAIFLYSMAALLLALQLTRRRFLVN